MHTVHTLREYHYLFAHFWGDRSVVCLHDVRIVYITPRDVIVVQARVLLEDQHFQIAKIRKGNLP